MVTHICLFTCVLALGQLPDRQSWQLAPQLNPGQELVYAGLYKEKSLVPGVAFHRDYRLQTRLLVLDATKDGWEVAILTALELLPDGPGSAPFTLAKLQKGSLRLELARVDKKGNVQSLEKVDLSMPLDGPPTLEHGFIVPVGGPRLTKLDQWMVADPGRPGQVWGILGAETLAGTKCVKMLAEQESPNWNDPQAAGDAWRRVDHIWFNSQLGIASRVDREVKRRDAARTIPTHAGQLRYDLDHQWTYPPGEMLDSRKQDVLSAVKFGREAEHLLQDHVKNAATLNVLIQRIKGYVEQKEPVEPYRQVMVQVLHRIDAVCKGEIKVSPPVVQKPLIPVAGPGCRVPDFVVTDLVNKRSVRLYEMLGRPILIIFYNPLTSTGTQTLRFAKKMQEQYPAKLQILGMAVTHKTAEAVAQHKELELPFPVVDGTGLHNTFAVEATPRMILIDGEGMVRGAYTGWGFLVTEQIQADLQKCCGLKKTLNP